MKWWHRNAFPSCWQYGVSSPQGDCSGDVVSGMVTASREQRGCTRLIISRIGIIKNLYFLPVKEVQLFVAALCSEPTRCLSDAFFNSKTWRRATRREEPHLGTAAGRARRFLKQRRQGWVPRDARKEVAGTGELQLPQILGWNAIERCQEWPLAAE